MTGLDVIEKGISNTKKYLTILNGNKSTSDTSFKKLNILSI